MTIEKGKRILLVGASGDLGYAVLERLSGCDILVGAHYCHNRSRLDQFLARENRAKIKLFSGEVSSQSGSRKIVQSFKKWAGGIDGLIQMSGSVSHVRHWEDLNQGDWDRDIAVNLSGPFFLAQEAMKHMKREGGKVIFTSTASASHGGGGNSMAYGTAKAGIECITKGLAREGAKQNILVNAVAPGLIMTKFHREQMHRTKKQLEERARLVPLKRAGSPEDVAGMVMYLLSPAGNYITGHIINVSGGDWL
ncbi:MAG: SDR family oxidoreductase [Candidatus Omnitrophota bacterium]